MAILFSATGLMICLALVTAFALVFRKLAAAGSDLPAQDGELNEISAHRYRPMERLLDKREYQMLERHPALNRKMIRQFRSRRVQAFRGYLRGLSADYNQVCAAIKVLIVHSAQDRADLAHLLVRQRATFTLRLMLTEARLSLHALGLGSVDVGNLVSALDSMRVELQQLTLAAQPAGA